MKVIHKIVINIITLVIMLYFLCGCSIKEDSLLIDFEGSIQDLAGLSAEQSQLPQREPKIAVNLTGYDCNGLKLAYFKSDKVGDAFQVINKDTKEVIYDGKILEEKVGYFTEITEPGTYYIKSPVIGQSYPFTIEESKYYDLLKDSLNQFGNNYGKELFSVAKLDLYYPYLLACEFYPSLLGVTKVSEANQTTHQLELPDILSEWKSSIKEWLKTTDIRQLSYEEGMQVASITAKLAYIYQQKDVELANMCLQLSQRSFQLVANRTNEIRVYEYLAACELYRLTGYSKYHNVIKELALSDELISINSDLKLYGDIVYLTTRRSVSITICNTMIDTIRAETKEMITNQSENRKNLDDVLHIIVLNHMITNSQYIALLEEKINYQMSEIEERDENFFENPLSILILSEIIHNQKEGNES